ncbi:MAG: methyltransferase domain-containing protein [Propionibacteriales bacterium]|nr:methyltransferase domain-containing protein [Propionibacteriales bacterium]
MDAERDAHEIARAVERQRELWRRNAPRYDRQMQFWEGKLFGDARIWICSRASGDVLEVAAGTCLNLRFYPPDARLTCVDLSPEMLDIGRERADRLGRAATIQEGDAHDLAFADSSFDSVVCTFSLCNIPDQRRAIAEMHRVLRPDGLLLLADHVVSTNRVITVLQRGLERLSLRFAGDHLTRRPYPLVVENGFVIQDHERYRAGIVERLVALKA